MVFLIAPFSLDPSPRTPNARWAAGSFTSAGSGLFRATGDRCGELLSALIQLTTAWRKEMKVHEGGIRIDGEATGALGRRWLLAS